MRAAHAPLIVEMVFVCEGSACRKQDKHGQQVWLQDSSSQMPPHRIVGDQCVIYTMKKLKN